MWVISDRGFSTEIPSRAEFGPAFLYVQVQRTSSRRVRLLKYAVESQSSEWIEFGMGGENTASFVAVEREENLGPCLRRRRASRSLVRHDNSWGEADVGARGNYEPAASRSEAREGEIEDVVKALLLTAEAAKPHTRTQSCLRSVVPSFFGCFFYLNGRLTLIFMLLHFLCGLFSPSVWNLLS